MALIIELNTSCFYFTSSFDLIFLSQLEEKERKEEEEAAKLTSETTHTNNSIPNSIHPPDEAAPPYKEAAVDVKEAPQEQNVCQLDF